MVACPHCHKSIDILSASEAVEEIRSRGWTKFQQNYIGTLKKKKQFPEPYITLAGREGWLRSQIDEWWDERNEERWERVLDQAAQTLVGLSGRELDKALSTLKTRIQSQGARE